MSAAILSRRIQCLPRKSPPSDGGDPTFAISYLTNTCGLSLQTAVIVSKKLRIKSRHNPDAVLNLLTNHGFTTAHISKLVAKWPLVLQSRPHQTLSPKLQFLRSIGIPDSISAQKLSIYPMILQRSLHKMLIPTYEFLKDFLGSDKKVVNVFARAPKAFAHGCCGEISSNIEILRERGVLESSIAFLLNNQPSLLMIRRELFVSLVDRATERGFDSSKVVFVLALQVFANMSELTLQRKMVAYMSCGWSESDVVDAFLRHPHCMNLSEKKIKANMGFLVDEMGFEVGDIARFPVILGYSLEKRMRPRWIVIRFLEGKSLLKKKSSATTLLTMSEEKFVKRIGQAVVLDPPNSYGSSPEHISAISHAPTTMLVSPLQDDTVLGVAECDLHSSILARWNTS